MRLNSIKNFLQTMHDYSSVNITQVFASEDKTRSLSVQFIEQTQVFSVFDTETNQLLENDSIDNTAVFIENHLKNSAFSISS